MKIGGEIMLAIRQKRITDEIIKHGFTLLDFEFKPMSNDEFDLIFKPNKTFSFLRTGEKTQGVLKTNLYTITPYLDGKLNVIVDFQSFDKHLSYVSIWLKALRENVEIGNPWEVISSSEWFKTSDEFDNYEELLSEEEQISIESKLDLILNKLEDLGIKNQTVVNDINYLKQATNRVSKKDWILMFSGVLFSWSFSAIMSHENLHLLISYAGSLFSTIKAIK